MTVIQIRILPTLKRLELRRQQHRLPDTPHGPSVSYRRLLLHIHTESCTWATCCRLHPGKKRDFEWGSNRASFLLGRSRVVQTWRRCSCEWTAWMGWSLCGVRIIAVNKEVFREEGLAVWKLNVYQPWMYNGKWIQHRRRGPNHSLNSPPWYKISEIFHVAGCTREFSRMNFQFSPRLFQWGYNYFLIETKCYQTQMNQIVKKLVVCESEENGSIILQTLHSRSKPNGKTSLSGPCTFNIWFGRCVRLVWKLGTAGGLISTVPYSFFVP